MYDLCSALFSDIVEINSAEMINGNQNLLRKQSGHTFFLHKTPARLIAFVQFNLFYFELVKVYKRPHVPEASK